MTTLIKKDLQVTMVGRNVKKPDKQNKEASVQD